MNEILIGRAMTCTQANLSLIKSYAQSPQGGMQEIIVAAVDCSEHSIQCVRSSETGSVLPETMELWCQSCQTLLDLIEASSLDTSELTAVAEVCEDCIRTCHRQPA